MFFERRHHQLIAAVLDPDKAIDRVLNKEGWIERCADAMALSVPKADIFQRVLNLGRQAGVAAKLGRAAM
jgi:hypothetical protein